MSVAEIVGSIAYTVTADTSALIGQTRVVERETGKMAGSFNAITAAIKVLATALALVKMTQLADEMRLLTARVEVAAGSIDKGAAAMGELRRISQRTQTQLEANVAVFNRLNGSIVQMGGTQEDTLRITELLGKAIKVSGVSGVEAASAMTQFGQALGSGVLQGDELRSLLENAPYLMRQLAAGIGVPVGALRQLGEEGKLTADVVTNALTRAASTIDADFQRLPQTFDAAMGAAADAAMRANEALDTLTGTSAALTGIARGTGDMLDSLASRLLSVTTEADRLGRSDTVGAWARATTTALSYAADAADIVQRTFRLAGIGVGAIAAQIGLLARGEFRAAADVMNQLGDDARSLLTTTLAGSAVRQQQAALGIGTDGSDPMDRRARGGAGSRLTAPALPGSGAGSRGNRAADSRASEYAAALQAQEEMLREAQEFGAKFIAGEQAMREQLDRDRGIAVALAQDISATGDPAAQVRLDAERKMAAISEARGIELGLELEFANARVSLEAETARRIADIEEQARQKRLEGQQQTLQGFGSLFEGMADVQKAFAGEQDGVYKALFAASKAFAIADSIIKIQQGIANAASLPFPANLGAMATVAAQTAGIVSTIQGASYGGGRQYGGPANAGTMYRVNETGRPEMFTAANGAQYMLPTQRGTVTPADAVGGGNVVNIHQSFVFNGDTFNKAEVVALVQRGGEATQQAVLQTLERTRR